MAKIINKYYEPELKQVRVVMLEDELMKLEQKLYDIQTFCKSFDPDKLTDKEKVILDSIVLIINGTIKVVK